MEGANADTLQHADEVCCASEMPPASCDKSAACIMRRSMRYKQAPIVVDPGTVSQPRRAGASTCPTRLPEHLIDQRGLAVNVGDDGDVTERLVDHVAFLREPSPPGTPNRTMTGG